MYENKKLAEANTKVLEGYVVDPPVSNIFTEEKEVNRDFKIILKKDCEH